MEREVGQAFTWERSFTEQEVRQFAELSGDRGAHHVQPGPDGRVMVQGLLTATLPTKIGGDRNFIAREMAVEFLRPVFSGDTLRVEVTVRDVDPFGDRRWAWLDLAVPQPAWQAGAAGPRPRLHRPAHRGLTVKLAVGLAATLRVTPPGPSGAASSVGARGGW